MHSALTHLCHRSRTAASASVRSYPRPTAIAVSSLLALAALTSGAPPAIALEIRGTSVFTPPTSVAPPFGQHTDLRVAMDENGDSTLVWRATVGEAHAIHAATIPSGSAEAGSEVALSGADRLNSPPVLAEAPSGRAAVAWFAERESQRLRGAEILALQARDLTPIGHPEPLQTVWQPAHLAGYSPGALAVAVDSAGDEVIAWLTSRTHASLMVTTRRAGGTFTAPVTLSPEAPEAQPAVGVSPNGEATVLWCNATNQQILASTWPAGSQPSSPTILDEGNSTAPVSAEHFSDLHLQTGASGEELATWLTGEHTIGRPHVVALRATWRSQGGPFAPAVSVSPPGVEAREPAIALSPAHGALLAWSEITAAGTGPVLNYATAPVGGAFAAASPYIAVANEGPQSQEPLELQDAWLPNGSMLMLWGSQDLLHLEHWSPSSALPVPIVAARLQAVSFEEEPVLLATGGAGSPVLAWIGRSPSDSETEAVHYAIADGLVGPARGDPAPVLKLAGSRDPVRERGVSLDVQCAEACAITAHARLFGVRKENLEEAAGDAYHELGSLLALHRTLLADTTQILRIRSTSRLLDAFCRSARRGDSDAIEVRVSVRGLLSGEQRNAVLGQAPLSGSCPR